MADSSHDKAHHLLRAAASFAFCASRRAFSFAFSVSLYCFSFCLRSFSFCLSLSLYSRSFCLRSSSRAFSFALRSASACFNLFLRSCSSCFSRSAFAFRRAFLLLPAFLASQHVLWLSAPAILSRLFVVLRMPCGRLPYGLLPLRLHVCGLLLFLLM